MTIYFEGQGAELIAVWTQYNGPVPNVKDVVRIDSEFYEVRVRVFTENGLRLHVLPAALKTQYEKQVRSFHDVLDKLDELSGAALDEMISNMNSLSQVIKEMED